MINGTWIDQFVEVFSTSGWTIFVEFWVVIITMTLIPFIVLMNNKLKKPSLEFQHTSTEAEIEKDNGNVYYTQVNFWINVTNKGKREAKNCHAFLTLMDEKFKENVLWKSSLPQYSVSQPFAVHWYFLDNKIDVVNIPISKQSGYSVKIPFNIELLQTSNEEWPFGNITQWEKPVQQLNDMPIDAPEHSEIFDSIFGIVIEVTYDDNKSAKARFLVKIPRDKKTEFSENDPSTIEFSKIKDR